MARKKWPEGTYMQVVAGAALRRRREALGLTVRDVARLMGRPNSFGFVARLEREEHLTCTPDFAESIAAILQRDIDELFMPRLPKKDRQERTSFRGPSKGRAA
jgi:transcriptional regulator with XRE-family HTH domain